MSIQSYEMWWLSYRASIGSQGPLGSQFEIQDDLLDEREIDQSFDSIISEQEVTNEKDNKNNTSNETVSNQFMNIKRKKKDQ